MEILEHAPQGGEAWHAARKAHFCASEAAAAMGASKYTTRDALLHQKATGISEEVSPAKQRLFDAGHAAEYAARSIAEGIAGTEFYPVVATHEVEGLPLLASFDGIDILEEVLWETKMLNQSLVAQVQAAELEPHYWAQLEHQMLVSNAHRVLFTTSDGTPDGTHHLWYESKPERRAQVLAAWHQFAKDVAAYVPPEAKAAPVVAAPMETLPAVSVRVDGQLAIISNLPAFGEALRAFIARIPDSPKTDQEFADTEAACKSLKQAEDALAASESNALAQLEDVDTMRRLVADCRNLARTTRLQKEKLVTAQKELLRGEAVAGGVTALRQHIAELHASVGKPWVQVPAANFGAVIKGMRSLESIRGAINDELARCKIEADAQARRIVANIRVLDQVGHGFLFPDAQQLATAHDADTFAGLVQGRIAQHQAAEQKRMDAERERIRAEEVARLERAAEAHAKTIAAEAAMRERKERQARNEAEMQRRAQEEAQAAERAADVIAQAAAPAPALLAISMNRCCEKAVAEGVEICQECKQSLEDWRKVRAQEHVDRSGTELMSADEYARMLFPPLPAAHDTGERINLSAINEYLAPIKMDAAGLAALGFEPVAVVKASKLYRASDLEHIRAALVRHLQSLALQAA